MEGRGDKEGFHAAGIDAAGVTAAMEAHANASASLRSQDVALVVDAFRGASYQSGEKGASDPSNGA